MQRCIIYLDCTRIPRKFVHIFIAPILLKFPDKYPVLPILNEALMDMKKTTATLPKVVFNENLIVKKYLEQSPRFNI